MATGFCALLSSFFLRGPSEVANLPRSDDFKIKAIRHKYPNPNDPIWQVSNTVSVGFLQRLLADNDEQSRVPAKEINQGFYDLKNKNFTLSTRWEGERVVQRDRFRKMKKKQVKELKQMFDLFAVEPQHPGLISFNDLGVCFC